MYASNWMFHFLQFSNIPDKWFTCQKKHGEKRRVIFAAWLVSGEWQPVLGFKDGV